jgi:hypothetical protein
MRDYLKDIYPDYDPQRDPDASLKFALAILVTNRRFRMFQHLLRDGDPISEISDDDAGWTLARRERHAREGAYAAWPREAMFRAYVDPLVYQLASPMAFFTRKGFAQLARPLLLEARLDNPPLNTEIDQTIALLNEDE